jgi:hypothetical protein
VSRAGCEYRVTVAAEMDVYPRFQPWVFVTPTIVGAREDGKLCVNVAWSPATSRLADVVGEVYCPHGRSVVSLQFVEGRLDALSPQCQAGTSGRCLLFAPLASGESGRDCV